MLYEIKVLKAPWPKGAKVGDVVDMPYLPVWAQGKCNIAQDGAQATIKFEEPVAADGVNRPLVPGQGEDAERIFVTNAELEDLRAKLAADEDEKLRLQQELDSATGTHDDLVKARDTALAEAGDLRAKLAAAEEAAATPAAAASTASKGKQR
jgi:hypothetical protein